MCIVRYIRKISDDPSCSLLLRESAGLYAADYFLWALQRFHEREEDRFLEYLWPSFRLVRDLDDTRHYKYGEYYTQKKPLTLAAKKNLPGI